MSRSVGLSLVAAMLLPVEGFQPVVFPMQHAAVRAASSSCVCSRPGFSHPTFSQVRMAAETTLSQSVKSQAPTTTRHNRDTKSPWIRLKHAFLGVLAVVSLQSLTYKHGIRQPA